MNPTVAFSVGADSVSAISSRKVSDFDGDQLRRGSEVFFSGSLTSERSVLQRTGSGMAGSVKGGLASLLSTSATSSSSLSQLHRASFSSDHFVIPATYSSDFSSLESSVNSRSLQGLSGLSCTPKSLDKSPGRWSVSASRNVMGPAMPGSVFSPLHSSLVHLPVTQQMHAASLPHRNKDRGASHFSQSRVSQVPAAPLSNFSSSVTEGSRVLGGNNALMLQAKPEKPLDPQAPFLRSVGFALPRNTRSDIALLATIPSANTLPEEGEMGFRRSSSGYGSGTDIEGAFLTPATSFSTLPDKDESPRLAAADGRAPVFHWEASILSSLKAQDSQRRQAVSGLSAGALKSSSLTSAAAAQVPGSSARTRKHGIEAERENILRFVEGANGLRPRTVSDLLREAQKEHPIFEHHLVKRAFEFAASAHHGQVRKNGEPFVAHCLQTALILAKIGANPTVVSAGLLHDVLDDTPITSEQLEAVFGPSIAGLVRGVSNLSSISQRMRDMEGALSAAESDRMANSGQALSETQLDLLRTMILSLEDVRIVLVKLADRIHNLRTLSGLSEEKQKRVASETLEVFAPLANRLGIWTWKAEIEDVCFRTLWPEEYRGLQVAVEGTHGDESVLRAIGKLDAELRSADVEFADLHGRSKNLYSIFNKMKNKGKKLSQVFDRRGIRLIVPDERSCYEALAGVRRVWREERLNHFKDYIKSPKGNGYQSLHVVVEDEDGHPLEIQIRTESMHQAAEYGVAAHWRYKEKRKGQGIQCSASRKAAADGGGVALLPLEEEEDSDEDEQFAMQRVEWARYLVSWVAELTDVKVRLSGEGGCGHGSPGSSRGSSPGCRGQGLHPGCSASLGPRSMCHFPEHAETCCFNPNMVLAAGGGPRPLLPESEPVLVLLVQNDKVAVKKLMGSSTRETFVRDFLAERGMLQAMGQASLLVNSELVPISSARFHMGDTVEVIMDAPLSPPVGVRTPSTDGVGAGLSPPLEDEELLFDAEALGGTALGGPTELLDIVAEGDLLPGFVREEMLPQFARETAAEEDGICRLAREFQRRRLAVAFGSSECLEIGQSHLS